MAVSVGIIPSTITLRDCPLCLAPPQMFRAELEDREAWAIVCPDCGFQMIGRRAEGLALDGLELVEVTKPGDDFDELVVLWNNMGGKG